MFHSAVKADRTVVVVAFRTKAAVPPRWLLADTGARTVCCDLCGVNDTIKIVIEEVRAATVPTRSVVDDYVQFLSLVYVSRVTFFDLPRFHFQAAPQ